jgi:dynein heavy chain 2, cytosolic
LLEILGQPSNPEVIQCHLNKLFAGIHRVSIGPHQSVSKEVRARSKEGQTLVAIVSADGEDVQFPSAVAVTTVVEEWLAGVSSEMRHALQVLLRDAGTKKGVLEPGSKEWAALPAQVLSLAQEISFTQVSFH